MARNFTARISSRLAGTSASRSSIARVGQKHFGGHIERLIGTKMGAIQLLPGTTHGSVAARQGYDPQDSAVLTMKELEKWLTLEIVGKYHQTVHRSLLRPPIAVWRDWEDKIPFELPSDRLAFWISFLPSEVRSLQRDGIHLFHIRYWSDALRGDVGRAPDPLTVKYDPRDMSRVFVRRMNGRWIEARYRDLRRPADFPLGAPGGCPAIAQSGEKGGERSNCLRDDRSSARDRPQSSPGSGVSETGACAPTPIGAAAVGARRPSDGH